MKKLLFLAFGLLVAASAAYSLPNDFKELKIKPLIEKAISVDQEAPVMAVDNADILIYLSHDWCILNYGEIIKENEAEVTVKFNYRWHRISRSGLDNYKDKAKPEKTFIYKVKRPDKK